MPPSSCASLSCTGNPASFICATTSRSAFRYGRASRTALTTLPECFAPGSRRFAASTNSSTSRMSSRSFAVRSAIRWRLSASTTRVSASATRSGSCSCRRMSRVLSSSVAIRCRDSTCAALSPVCWAMAARGTPKSAVRRFVASARSRYPIGRARRAAKISPALVMSDTSLGCTRAGISRHPSIRHAISRRLPSTMIYPCAAARTRIGSRSPSRAIDAASVSSGICESDFCCTLGLSAICSVGSSAISVCAHCA